MGAQMVREVASKTSDIAGDGTTTATVLAAAIVKEGAKAVAAGMNPMDLKRGIDLAVEAVVEDLKKNSKKVTSNDEIAQVGTISANGDSRDRPLPRRGDEEGRQRGRDHGRRGQDPRDRARRRRGHAVRPRLHLALLHHQRRQDARRDGRPLHPDQREEALGPAGAAPAARGGGADRQAAADRRRGRRGRGARHARRQQAARRPQGRGRQGAGLRRSPQGHAAGHRGPDRRPGDLAKTSASSSRTSRSTCSAAPRR